MTTNVRGAIQNSNYKTLTMTDTRREKDPLGPLDVPTDALYGVQTLRAKQNFPICRSTRSSTRRSGSRRRRR